ncbi:MAG TPA: VOC family protein [Chitinophaga sp.]|nr:VOC family protein [Chitinophaga sp.]
MALTKLIPKIFYSDIAVGLKFFIEGLGFELTYNDDSLYIVKRDQILLLLVIDEEPGKTDRPEIRIETDDIQAIYQEIKTNHPEILHPNLNHIKNQPWGLREFAVLDPTTVCVIFQQSID